MACVEDRIGKLLAFLPHQETGDLLRAAAAAALCNVESANAPQSIGQKPKSRKAGIQEARPAEIPQNNIVSFRNAAKLLSSSKISSSAV